MKETVNECNFVDRFRQLRPDNFSYAGLHALFEYFEELEEETGIEIELDVIAICCEYTEYDSLADFCLDFGPEYETIEDLSNETTVIMIDSESFIIVDF